MSEPFLERLTRFTPNAAGLDRDALLFAAGRSSARPNRAVMAVASVLAGSQVLSLFLLWPHPDPGSSPSRTSMAIAKAPAVEGPALAREFEAPASPGLSSARRSMLEPMSEYRPPADVTLIDSGPPLRATGPVTRSLLN